MSQHAHSTRLAYLVGCLLTLLVSQRTLQLPMPRIPLRDLTAILAAMVVAASAHADVTEQEAIQAQLAGALASADYAARKCPNLTIDQARIEAVLKRSGKTIAQLKASEDYADQRDVILSMEKGKQGHLICMALPNAHGGFGRGIITEK